VGAGSLRWVAGAVATAWVVLGSCTPVSKSYEIHTGDLTCDEANRDVYDAVIGMDMVVTAFKPARPGHAGYLQAKRDDPRGAMSGNVDIRCDPDAVHIVASQSGLMGEHEFERGVFLGVTGRAGLVATREGRGIGALVKRSAPAGETAGTGPGEPAAPGTTPSSSSAPATTTAARSGSVETSASQPTRTRREVRGVQVKLEPLRGFASVLDFEADLSAAGILPVKVTVVNGTNRVYEFDPRDIVLRRAGSRERARPLTPTQAVDRLLATNAKVLGRGGGQAGAEAGAGPVDARAASELGDVDRAADVIPERQLKAARLRPYQEVSGFLYYQVADYDRARVTMVDVATGETEGFIVDF
jgi:hypothetical protein